MSAERPRSLGALAAGALLGFALAALGVGRGVDLSLLDRMQRMAPLSEPQVALLDLDTRTVSAWGWPLDPVLYEAVFQTLHDAGAKGIGVDLLLADRGRAVFAEDEIVATPGDAALGETAARLGVILGVQRVHRQDSERTEVCGEDRSAQLIPLRAGFEDVRRATLHVRPDPVDGVVRWAMPCVSTPDGCMQDLASAVVGQEPVCDDTLIPYSRGFEDFPKVSLYEVITLSGTDEGMAKLEAIVGGRYVIVGPSDASVADVGHTPASPHEPLFAVHANRVQALVEGRSIGFMGPFGAAGLGVLLTLLLSPLRWPARGWLAVSGSGLAFAWVVSLAAFRALDLWLPWTAVAFPWVLGTLSAAGWQGWLHLRHNQMVTQAFGRYVSPDVLDWLKTSGGGALAPSAAERREIAVLFSDVAGYTRMSNRLGADAVMDSLRLYLDAMVPIVQKHGGYLDKINGDGLMVLFGAPRPLDDCSTAAVACAAEMQARVRAMQREWRAITDGDLVIRVGIATGEAFVGNLGAEGHVEYTAIGPVVNLAARLESKAPLGGIAMSEETHDALGTPPPGEWVGLELKGYDAGDVRAWAVPGAFFDAS